MLQHFPTAFRYSVNFFIFRFGLISKTLNTVTQVKHNKYAATNSFGELGKVKHKYKNQKKLFKHFKVSNKTIHKKYNKT